jgi:hypothetical protein
MDHNLVQLIGVGPTANDKPFEAFVYTTNAPTNLWIGAICDDGSRMSLQFMAYILNGLIVNDSFNENDTFELNNQDGVSLVAEVGELQDGAPLEANLANTKMVRIVRVRVV